MNDMEKIEKGSELYRILGKEGKDLYSFSGRLGINTGPLPSNGAIDNEHKEYIIRLLNCACGQLKELFELNNIDTGSSEDFILLDLDTKAHEDINTLLVTLVTDISFLIYINECDTLMYPGEFDWKRRLTSGM